MPQNPLNFSRRALLKTLAATSVFSAQVGKSFAQSYPARPITLVVTFAAGGGVDVTTRLIAEWMSEALGQRVVVENRAGGATMTGSQSVAKGVADGYLLLAAPTTMVLNPSLRTNIPFDWATELRPVGLMAKLPFVVVTRPDAPFKTMKEFEEFARKKGAPSTFASGGTGTVAHLAGELFASRTKVPMQHIPYRGEGPSLVDVASGTLDVTFATMAGVAGQVQAGTLRALGVTTAERAALLQNVPTIQEQGYPDFDVSAWIGLMVPSATPSDIVTRLGTVLDDVLAKPENRERLAKIGAIAASKDQNFPNFLRSEAATWSKIIGDAKIKVD